MIAPTPDSRHLECRPGCCPAMTLGQVANAAALRLFCTDHGWCAAREIARTEELVRRVSRLVRAA